jgi:ribosomal protein L16/L10AE
MARDVIEESKHTRRVYCRVIYTLVLKRKNQAPGQWSERGKGNGLGAIAPVKACHILIEIALKKHDQKAGDAASV